VMPSPTGGEGAAMRTAVAIARDNIV
jgi:hypothetical protein